MYGDNPIADKMSNKKETGYILFLVISLLTFLFEAALNCILAVYVYQHEKTTWLVTILCLLTIPSILVQVVSFIFQQRNSPPKTTWWRETGTILVHVLQLAIPWRYTRMFLSSHISMDAKEIWQSFVLRVLHSLTCTLPILFVQVYLMLIKLEEFTADKHWYLIVSCVASLVSAAWCLATYQKHQKYCCAVGLTPPLSGTSIRFIWRVGELLSRMLTLGLFALAHKLWIFLVIGFHWLTMLLLLLVDHVLHENQEKENKVTSAVQILMKSYIYIFSHLNLTSKKSKYGFVFFYIISCLESIALLILWIIYDDRKKYHMPFGITVAGGYIVALIFALIYYNCFHRKTVKRDNTERSPQQQNNACMRQCAECNLDSSIPKQRAIHFDSTKPWLQVSGCPNPNYFSDILHSDCASDRSSDILVSHHPHIHTNGSLGVAKPRHLLRLDARVLNSNRCRCTSSDNSSDKSSSIRKLKPVMGVPNVGLEWDDCDLQVRETPEGASNPEIKESPRSNLTTSSTGVASKRASLEGESTKDESVRNTTGTIDQGYFSTMSVSSKGTHKKVPKTLPNMLASQHQQQQHYMSAPKQSFSRKDALRRLKHHSSDETASSSFSTTSSRVPILNCKRCGHCVSIDSVSMYSVTSTNTSMGSSAYAHNRRYFQYGSMEYLDPTNKNIRQQRKADERLSAGVTQSNKKQVVGSRRCATHNADLQRPISAQEPPRSGYAHNNHIKLLSGDGAVAEGACKDSQL